jgi:cyclic pyranopterin phosphate synthase
MSLQDPFGRAITYLRISVTDRCNLRCAYCMPRSPAHVEREDVLTFEEIDRLVRVALDLGWKKVRLTGGEPLVRKNCVELIRTLARHKHPGTENRLRALVMTSNGLLLSRFAAELKDAGLDRVNVSLDTLVRERFRRITGFDRLLQVQEGIEAAIRAGLTPVKINTVLLRGSTEDEFFDFVDLARERPIDVRFIEFMPFSGNGWTAEKVLSTDELERRLRGRHDPSPVPTQANGGPAETFAAPGWRGTISFISPLTKRSFCHDCNRVRMTSEGRLRGCLLDENEMDFRAALRGGATDRELADLFRRAVAVKPREHAFHRMLEEGAVAGPVAGRHMHRIGG